MTLVYIMAFVYIIESISSGIWYYGYSTDLEKRLRGHNNGLNVSTQGRGPWQFIFVREFLVKAEALAFERLLKKSKNKKYSSHLKKLIRLNLKNP